MLIALRASSAHHLLNGLSQIFLPPAPAGPSGPVEHRASAELGCGGVLGTQGVFGAGLGPWEGDPFKLLVFPWSLGRWSWE